MTDYMAGFVSPPYSVGEQQPGRWVYALRCEDEKHRHLTHGSMFECHPSYVERGRERYGVCYQPVRRWVSDWEPVVVQHDEEAEA